MGTYNDEDVEVNPRASTRIMQEAKARNGIESFAKHLGMVFFVAAATASIVLWISSSQAAQDKEVKLGQEAQDKSIKQVEVNNAELRVGLATMNEKIVEIRKAQEKQNDKLDAVMSVLLDLKRAGVQ